VTEAAARRLLDRSIRFLENFAGCFGNPAQRSNPRRYLRGLLGEAQRKLMAPMLAAPSLTADTVSVHRRRRSDRRLHEVCLGGASQRQRDY